MADKCVRCGKSIFMADKPQKMSHGAYHAGCFKCATCGTRLTMATVKSADGEIYCKRHMPVEAPTSTIDVTTMAALNAPDSNHTGQREFTKGSGSSNYGAGAVGLSAAKPKPPSFGHNRGV